MKLKVAFHAFIGMFSMGMAFIFALALSWTDYSKGILILGVTVSIIATIYAWSKACYYEEKGR